MSLIIKNLRKTYAEREIISNFSYEFESKGVYVIKGKSGIGKTTLLRLIAGIDSDYQGEIIGGGIKNVSFMFQEYRLFDNISAIKNVFLAVHTTTESMHTKAMNLLSELKLSEDDVKKSPRELSGGMKQRISFARAFMKDSPILLLDEPTKELDDDSVRAMINIINNEGHRRLVLIVTHDELDQNLEISGSISL